MSNYTTVFREGKWSDGVRRVSLVERVMFKYSFYSIIIIMLMFIYLISLNKEKAIILSYRFICICHETFPCLGQGYEAR